ncbi:MAG: hypothetical protein K6A36_02515 [Paludibacteraceae bacterium]|nr:hypothetical protein [Paludibacteraceae bacterium]
MRRIILILLCVSAYTYVLRAQEISCIAPDTSKAVILFTSNGGTLIDSEFSLSETKKVRFARGNLMYQPSTNTWKIADRQYDFVGGNSNSDPKGEHGTIYVNGVKSTNNVANRAKYAGWLDLFSWGASGWYGAYYNAAEDSTKNVNWRNKNNPQGKVTCNPWEVDGSANYNLGCDIHQGMVAPYDSADWGVLHNIELGGTPEATFRTPTLEEWRYLFYERENADKLLALATIRLIGKNGAPDTLINGALLLPNDWEERKPLDFHFKPYSQGGNRYSMNGGYNVYTEEEWNYMEGCGAIFLPACGGGSNNSNANKQNRSGYYWTATLHTDGKVYDINWGPSDAIELKPGTRSYSRAVRLCQDIVE